MIYLDNSATTLVRQEVLQEMMRIYQEVPGNPSSMHQLGIEAERELRGARKRLASLLNVSEFEIVFTAGGTEANNLAIQGTAGANPREFNRIVTTSIEHPSVSTLCRGMEFRGYQVVYCPANGQGLVNADEIIQLVNERTLLVSVMMVNNELGSIQPVGEIGRRLKALPSPPLFHVDAVQGFGRYPIHPREQNIDLLTLSAHKIGGPKGVGALYIRKDTRFRPLWLGGGQERGFRSGTENVAGAVGLARAAELSLANHEATLERYREMRRRLTAQLEKDMPEVEVNGAAAESSQAPYIISLRIPGAMGEALVRNLEVEKVYVSTQAACASRKSKVSPVLLAIGLSERASSETIRVSLGYQNTPEEIDHFAETLVKTVKKIKKNFERR